MCSASERHRGCCNLRREGIEVFMNRHRIVAQGVAMLCILSMVRVGRGAPGDVFNGNAASALTGNMLDASPPKGADLRAGDASVSTQTGALRYSYPIEVPPGEAGERTETGALLLVASADLRRH